MTGLEAREVSKAERCTSETLYCIIQWQKAEGKISEQQKIAEIFR